MSTSWEDRFKVDEYVYGENPNRFIYEMASHLDDCQTVAAFAEGEGRNAVFLAREGYKVTAFDYAESGLKKTRKLAEKHEVEVKTRHIDLLVDEVVKERFDAAMMVFGHFEEKDQPHVFHKIIDAVKPGGKLMMEVYSKEQIHYRTGGPRDSKMLYDPKNFLQWCKGHRIIHFFYGEQVREEGLLHTGLAHVIQIVLQKEEQ